MKKLALAALLLAGLLFAVPTDDPDSANCACECADACECANGGECTCAEECADACECADGGECTCTEGCANACESKEAAAEPSSCSGMNMGSCGGCGR